MIKIETNYSAINTPKKENEIDFHQKIAAAEEQLAILAQVVGADFGMSVKFGELGKGSYFDTENNAIFLDPMIIMEDKEYLAEFVAGHEGGHRAITRSLEQIGMPKEKAIELYKKLGFGYLYNCLEDCADNQWVGNVFEKFRDDCRRVYDEQFVHENAALTTPEIDRLIARLGYVPKFVSGGSEIIRRWAGGSYSEILDEAVVSVLQKTEDGARQYESEIPGNMAKEMERLVKAKERFRIMYERIWPEFEKLINEDIDQEKMRQLAGELKEKGHKKEKRTSVSDGLPSELKDELDKKTEERLRELLEKINKKIDELNEQSNGAATVEDKEKIAENIGKLLADKEALENGEICVVPWDKLSDELKNKLKEIFDKLPVEVKKKLEATARKTLEELDDKLIKETRGKMTEDNNPPTHGEIKAEEERIEDARRTDEENERKRLADKKENDDLVETLQKEIEGDLSEYDRIYKEIAPLADQLYDRIHKIFLPKRHPRWEKGKPTGQRLDLAKAMQFEADRGLYDKLWESRTIPRKIDYCFTLLIDLSHSMSNSGAIEPTFRGVILLAEVLNRLGIKVQIVGFQDKLILYKDFDEELSSLIRKKMTVMRKEVDDKGENNQSEYNSDGYCLGQASEQLEKQKGKDSFLIVLSDGLPEPDNAHMGRKFDLKKVIKNIRQKTRQKLIGVGLGPGTEHVAKFYPVSLPNINLEQLTILLGDLLEDMIAHPSRY